MFISGKSPSTVARLISFQTKSNNDVCNIVLEEYGIVENIRCEIRVLKTNVPTNFSNECIPFPAKTYSVDNFC